MTPTGSVSGTLKNELMHHRRQATREQARLGFLSPAAFSQQYLSKGLLRDTVSIYTNSNRPHCFAWRAFARARPSKTFGFYAYVPA